ncbi:hypothetical protein L3V77_18290 [Vibrio sp. DW001]|uniref:hypothetical protein n=1 Tax=Vibrio sp. DW001 TaxID=2912315 RepID=UPI0023AEF0AD|nr:hypothetical protein [Vibrio sp. DW001]WED29379.1 hypothetical protein L3V77_18290 [Vibrio sp. DW001]
MKLVNKMLGIMLISIVFISGCSSNSGPRIKAATLTKGVTYKIESFEVDLAYRIYMEKYLDEERTTQVMRKQFETTLQQANLLASDTSNNVLPINVYFDYRRVFAGEDTPFPSDVVSSPNFMYQITTFEQSEVMYIINSSKQISLSSVGAFLDLFTKDTNVSRDALFSISAAHLAAEKLISVTPGIEFKEMSDEIYPEVAQYMKSVFEEYNHLITSGLHTDYIPKSIAQDYIARLKSDNFETRKSAYKELQKQWNNQDEIYQYLESQLLSIYMSDLTEQQVDEVEYQLETIAMSGLINYQDTLKKISTQAKSESLKEMAWSNLEVLQSRKIRANNVHKPLPTEIVLDWKEHQLFNMIMSNDIYLQKTAVQRIYREFPKNEILLDALSLSLDEASSRSYYKTQKRRDYHAWLCRVLGMSENQKYKAKLDYTAINANWEKVRKYAMKYAAKLE